MQKESLFEIENLLGSLFVGKYSDPLGGTSIIKGVFWASISNIKKIEDSTAANKRIILLLNFIMLPY